MEATLTLEHISKRYGPHQALKDVSFRAEAGEVIALLGRNGAGKSTLMNILTGYIAMSQGRALVCGHDVQSDPMAARRAVGYLPEQPPLYPDMTVTEYLRYCAQLKAIPHEKRRAEMSRVIDLTGLGEYAGRLCGRLSKGYRQRLGVAQALLGTPALIILDEPGSGLDPLQMAQMREVIRAAGKKSTVLLSSHILSEVTSVCGRAVVLERGEMRYDGAMDELVTTGHTLRILFRGGEAVSERLQGLPGVRRICPLPQEGDCQAMELCYDPAWDVRGDVFRLMVSCGAELVELSPCRDSLETAFLRLLNREEETL